MLTDSEVRHLAISLLTAPTDRDRQQRVGASNLSSPCDFCLASNLTGDFRETPMLDRAWGGRVIGTAIHSIMEERLHEALEQANADIVKNQTLAAIGRQHPDALIEFNMSLGTLGTYGEVRSTTDLALPSSNHAIDWKGTSDAKMALTLDFLAIDKGEPAPFGRLHKAHKAKPLSENVYAQKIADQKAKVTGYYSQLQFYMRGLRLAGHDITRASIVFISRDSTMWFDSPSQDGYDDPTKLKGVSVLSFDWNEAYADTLWQRALDIWAHLEAGGTPADLKRHDSCFACSLEARDNRPAATAA